ncbi:hypothetical protein [Cellulosilyticum sp. I15G10I2]|uniref:hypothetical protein n=1 Tax=Cellulosilyticum sp. I15G10I2 TaxID=1892843 RepID=UPI00085BEAFF|nr:hypothetical protein [Cellulosilyticum sp. I15G10I2]
MENKNLLKLLVSIMLSTVIIFANIPLYATNGNDIIISDAKHKQTIEEFLGEIKNIEGQVTDIALLALKSSSTQDGQLQSRINLIENNIQRLNKIVQDYLKTVPEVGERNRHVLLTFNALNLIKGSLYILNLLVNITDDIESFELLEEYFYSRATALDTLEILEEILSKFDT